MAMGKPASRGSHNGGGAAGVLIHSDGLSSVPDLIKAAEKPASCGPHNDSGHADVPLQYYHGSSDYLCPLISVSGLPRCPVI